MEGHGQIPLAELKQEKLHRAVRNNDYSTARELIRDGADPTWKNSEEKNALHVLCSIPKKEEILRLANLLLEKIVSRHLKDQDKKKCTALHYAVRQGHTKVAELLIKKIAEAQNCEIPNLNDSEWLAEGGSLLNYAARGGCLETVELLIKKGVKLDPDLTSSKITSKNSPLKDAIEHRCTEVAVFLVEKGADVTPEILNQAITCHQKKVAETILKLHGLEPLRGTISEGRWSALRCTQVETTPFREAIRKLPDLAKNILDQCVVEGDLKDNPHDLDYSIAFNYEFIDDIQDDNENRQSTSQQQPNGNETSALQISPDSNSKRQSQHQPAGNETSCFTSVQIAPDPNSKSSELKEKIMKAFPGLIKSNTWGPKEFNKRNHPLSLMVTVLGKVQTNGATKPSSCGNSDPRKMEEIWKDLVCFVPGFLCSLSHLPDIICSRDSKSSDSRLFQSNKQLHHFLGSGDIHKSSTLSKFCSSNCDSNSCNNFTV